MLDLTNRMLVPRRKRCWYRMTMRLARGLTGAPARAALRCAQREANPTLDIDLESLSPVVGSLLHDCPPARPPHFKPLGGGSFRSSSNLRSSTVITSADTQKPTSAWRRRVARRWPDPRRPVTPSFSNFAHK